MKNALLIASIVFCIPPLAAQSQSGQAEPYGFKDLRLGMSIAEFKANHPAPPPRETLDTEWQDELKHPGTAACTPRLAKGTIVCSYVDSSDPLNVSVTFVDSKLAEIALEDHDTDTAAQFCFSPVSIPLSKPLQRQEYSLHCPKLWPLWKSLTGNLGQVKFIASPKNEPSSPDPLYAMWWQNDTSVAEFQDHICLPSYEKDGRTVTDESR